MDQNKMKRAKDAICDRLEQMDPSDLAKPAMVEYYRNMASLHCKLSEICEAEEGGESYRSSYRGSYRGAYREGPEWGAYDDGSYRRGRSDRTGRYVSYAEGGDPKEQLRSMMDDPSMPRENREILKRAMAEMR